jgi:hypothetical protein
LTTALGSVAALTGSFTSTARAHRPRQRDDHRLAGAGLILVRAARRAITPAGAGDRVQADVGVPALTGSLIWVARPKPEPAGCTAAAWAAGTGSSAVALANAAADKISGLRTAMP